MFKRLAPDGGTTAQAVHLTVNDRAIVAQAGDTVAAALLAAGELQFGVSPTASKPRGPYCMMGVCFECLVSIDGRADRQACMTSVRQGMKVIFVGETNHHG